jgi:hypothetical protein
MPIDVTLRWDHLKRLTGPLGLYEHALYDVPRTACGYTTDDNGRALVVLARAEPTGVDPAPYLRHVLGSFDGRRLLLRRRSDGRWLSEYSDDAQARGLWGLGEWIGSGRGSPEAERVFEAGLRLDSGHPRANAYMILGVAAASRLGPSHPRQAPQADAGPLGVARPEAHLRQRPHSRGPDPGGRPGRRRPRRVRRSAAPRVAGRGGDG